MCIIPTILNLCGDKKSADVRQIATITTFKIFEVLPTEIVRVYIQLIKPNLYYKMDQIDYGMLYIIYQSSFPPSTSRNKTISTSTRNHFYLCND